MRIRHSIYLLTILATVAACSSPANQADAAPAVAAVAPAPAAVVAADPAPTAAISLTWDSAPLDLAYHRERNDMEARHTRELAHPRAGESATQRTRRHEAETKNLEVRYTRGKTAHARTMPPNEP